MLGISFGKPIPNSNVRYSRFVLSISGKDISADGLAACSLTIWVAPKVDR